ncbi:MAG: adenine phosphoribosyltransferase [Candidatus Omnitrophota bacterium]
MEQPDLKRFIRDVPDFPKPGILFKDITPLLKNHHALEKTIAMMAEKYKSEKIDYVVAVESRGFIFGALLAQKLSAGLVPIRKKGKLPYKTKQVSYDLEYGKDTLEIHEDALEPGKKVLIVDDLLATGGTVKAVVELVNGFSVGIVGAAFVVELKFLNGRDKLKDLPVYSIIQF